MADEQINAVADEQQVQFAIQRIYVKDISFEARNSPAIFRKEWTSGSEIGSPIPAVKSWMTSLMKWCYPLNRDLPTIWCRKQLSCVKYNKPVSSLYQCYLMLRWRICWPLSARTFCSLMPVKQCLAWSIAVLSHN